MTAKVVSIEPVLFILIGWSRKYDGTEAPVGGHGYLKGSPRESAEMAAFIRQKNGKFSSGAGKGELHERTADAVFVARHPNTRAYEVVAVYLKAKPHMEKNQWCTLTATKVIIFPEGNRPNCPNWPAGQGMRRWAKRVASKGNSHSKLLATYRLAVRRPKKALKIVAQDVDIELSAFEGKLKHHFVAHRKREASLRAKKIELALRDGKGHLVCEVPGCGFEFLSTYGAIGQDYAIVHHTKPLGSLSKEGSKTSLADLAIVCANCHAMIHRGGSCRPMKSLIPRSSS
jgi:hypothetical protein